LPHRTVAHWIQRWATEKDHKAVVELLVAGTSHHADVGLQLPNGRWNAFEVVDTCDTNVVDAVKASLLDSTAVEALTLVAFQKQILARLKKMIDAEASLRGVLDRVHYETAEFFMSHESSTKEASK